MEVKVKYLPEQLLRQAKSIGSLPTSYHRITSAINDPKSTNKVIGHIISADVGLTARLMQLVNSAFFSLPTKIDTVSRAVSVVGSKYLKELILATKIIDLFKENLTPSVSMELFWKHSIACGITAKILAEHIGDSNVERYFVFGLLHDIGRLIMFMTVSEEMKALMNQCKKEKELLYSAEKKMFGFDHSLLGGLLLKQWELPEVTVSAVACHHKPSSAGNSQTQATIVHASDIIVNALRIGTSGEEFIPPLDATVWEPLGIPDNELPGLVDQLKKQYKETVGVILQ